MKQITALILFQLLQRASRVPSVDNLRLTFSSKSKLKSSWNLMPSAKSAAMLLTRGLPLLAKIKFTILRIYLLVAVDWVVDVL